MSATDPVDGALIAGINGSKALVRHACIAQLLQLGAEAGVCVGQYAVYFSFRASNSSV